MPSNPMIPQGTLNRLRGSMNITGSPELNVTASFLAEAGITFQLEGATTEFINTMVGVVTSPQPFMMATCVVNILKTQGIAALYKARMESDARIGDFVVTPDAVTLPTYIINNAAIESVREMTFNGKDPGFSITLKGAYFINNDLWNI